MGRGGGDGHKPPCEGLAPDLNKWRRSTEISWESQLFEQACQKKSGRKAGPRKRKAWLCLLELNLRPKRVTRAITENLHSWEDYDGSLRCGHLVHMASENPRRKGKGLEN